jgi:uncharacterized SAM-binding protein YcdF (DUF218 family)
MVLFWIMAIVKAAVLPPAGPILLALTGIAMSGRHPRRGRAVTLLGVASLLLLSMPVVAALLIRALDRSPPLDMKRASNAQAIVILGGGTRHYAPEFGGETMNVLTLERVRYGARLARATGLPVLVSGGSVGTASPEAPLMRNALVNEYGIAVRWIETRSRDTHENAVESAAILKPDGVKRVILVGHSFDFPRVRNEFEAAGVDVIPAPMGTPSRAPVQVRDFLPTPAGLQLSYYALYEILANTLYAAMH